ncbi:hypothetical protein [Methanocella sp. MCL-LM]|uniref:hypothetical protein n=1 Tax=Methanocella sp. MCL-LM TaxID=3412035 RepID=UPI003C720111
MAREKDYLDAVAFIGISIMFGPFLFQILLFLLTGTTTPIPDVSGNDVVLITYIGGLFFFTGLLILLYVAYRRFIEGMSASK